LPTLAGLLTADHLASTAIPIGKILND